MRPFIILSTGIGIFILGILSVYASNTFNIKQKIETFFSPETVEIQEEEKITDKTIDTSTQFIFYFDFSCPYCRDFFTNTYLPLIEEYSGKNVDFTLLPYSTKTIGKSFTLATYLTCIEKIDPTKTYAFISAVSLTDDIQNKEEFAKKINTLLFPTHETTDFLSCIQDEDESAKQKVLDIRTEARAKGVIGTPTFFINTQKFERNQSYTKVSTALEKVLSQ